MSLLPNASGAVLAERNLGNDWGQAGVLDYWRRQIELSENSIANVAQISQSAVVGMLGQPEKGRRREEGR
jgi:hypothetical protein